MTRYCLIILLVLVCTIANGQGYDGTLKSLLYNTDKYQTAHQPEKLYLQLDKCNYSVGDTLWFKAYLFNAATMGASNKSRIAYIELSDESNIVQVRKLVVIDNGLGWGCIPLSPRDFPEGGYTLRAYTQWMRNFDESLIFKQQFYVSDLNQNHWLINIGTTIVDNKAKLHMQLYQPNKQLVSNQLMQLGIRQGDRVLQWEKMQTTSPEGMLDLDIAMLNKPETRYAYLQKGVNVSGAGIFGTNAKELDSKWPEYKFPIITPRPEKMDVQFMPEGGYLVNGILTTVGFKAIDENGMGVDVTGKIINAATQQEIVNFKSVYKGIGSFKFTPQANISYKVIVNLPGGSQREYVLPEIKLSGTALSVVNNSQGDSVTIKIASTPDMDGRYTLLGQSRGNVCFAARASLSVGNNHVQIFKAAKSIFATGIVKFTLLNESLNTLNERLIYIDRHDALTIKVTPHQQNYAPQDSIALQVEVKNNKGEPVQGAFSMAVINDLPLVNQDQIPINASVLFAADLKGYIETPGYYFEGDKSVELDNLLLTQGWSAYNWKQILEPESPDAFAAEHDIAITGKVTNVFGKPTKNADITLTALRPFYQAATKTDDNGQFILGNLPQIDSAIYIRARNEKGRPGTNGIDIKRVEMPTFAPNRIQTPWFINTDALKLQVADTLLSQQKLMDDLPDNLKGTMLKEVSIKAKKIVRGSHNLNGPGNADQVIDEHDIAKEKPTTLLELLKKTVKGFVIAHGRGALSYTINYESFGLIMDGVDVRGLINSREFSINGNPDYDYYKSIFEYYTSDDIKGIEVMSKSYNGIYQVRKIDPRCRRCTIDVATTYLEITTRQGTGPFMKRAPADVIYKPIPSVLQKDFYRPIYKVKNAIIANFDQRNTIYWEPDIITDKDGKATITFYAAGQPANYTITTQGSNMDGNLGSNISKLVIK